MSVLRNIIPFPCLIAALLVPGIARASDPAAAQALFDDGKELMARGLAQQACPKFEESQRLDPGMGTEFHLADCWQHIGRTASAWAMFREVESQAHASGQAARERVAHDRATALEPFVSKIVITPQGAGEEPGLRIDRDGVAIDEPLWGTPVPVDPGPHVVHALAPRKVAWQTIVGVPPQGRVVTVDVPALLDETPPAVAVAPPPPPAPAPVPAPAPTPPPSPGAASMMPPSAPEEPVLENRGGFQRGVGWFFVGAGVVGLAAGAYFGVHWLDDEQAAVPHCVGDACDAYGLTRRDDAHTQARYTVITAGAGAGALLLGAILVGTAPSPRIVMKDVAGLQLVPIAGPGQGGLGIHGTW
jgi:serine/threonine-protein kinase